jgi:hypothetical protein
MNVWSRLLDLVSPNRNEPTAKPESWRERIFIAAIALLTAIGLGGLWGIAAGSHDHHFAFDNVGKVPVLLIASSLVALPIGLFVFRLVATRGRTTDLIMAHAVGTFAGCATLALLAPLVALYQYSSSFAGVPVALGSAVLGAIVAFGVLVRVLRKIAPQSSRAHAGAVGLMLALQLAALAQLASMTTPVFPSRTPFGRGVDGIAHVQPESP